jgi:hypothetical protein
MFPLPEAEFPIVLTTLLGLKKPVFKKVDAIIETGCIH